MVRKAVVYSSYRQLRLIYDELKVPKVLNRKETCSAVIISVGYYLNLLS